MAQVRVASLLSSEARRRRVESNLTEKGDEMVVVRGKEVRTIGCVA